MQIKVKYHKPDTKRLVKIEKGDWVDLSADEDVELNVGDFKLINLGVSIELPEGYEANIVPRSSTFKNWGILQTNSFGVVDATYCGDSDIWRMPVYATRYTRISRGDRICQFRINKVMPPISFMEVESLDNESRGGFGSTGVN